MLCLYMTMTGKDDEAHTGIEDRETTIAMALPPCYMMAPMASMYDAMYL